MSRFGAMFILDLSLESNDPHVFTTSRASLNWGMHLTFLSSSWVSEGGMMELVCSPPARGAGVAHCSNIKSIHTQYCSHYSATISVNNICRVYNNTRIISDIHDPEAEEHSNTLVRYLILSIWSWWAHSTLVWWWGTSFVSLVLIITTWQLTRTQVTSSV